MDDNLINTFRDKVNEDNMVFNMYHCCNNKNKWNIICSAMDWITVAVDGINEISLPSNANNNLSSIAYISFIMCIDILWESIQQLHRVIFNTSKIPFRGEKRIFRNNILSKSDNEYFKTIRACFAAHPVNLDDHFTSLNKKEKRYASWSGRFFGSGDFSVILYSNVIGEDDIVLSIYTSNLIEFAETRYNYLNTLIEELNRQKNSCLSILKNTPIQKSESIIEQIDILISECKKRIDDDYYTFELKKLRILFSTPITSQKNLCIVSQYRESLSSRVDEIFRILQEMDMDGPSDQNIFNDFVPFSCHYSFSKLADTVYGHGHTLLVDILSFKNILDSILDFDNIMSPLELYVVVLAGFFVIHDKK